MAQKQPRIVNLEINLRSTIDILGIVGVLLLIVYTYVWSGRADFVTVSNYGFGILSMGGLLVYVVTIAGLTHRYSSRIGRMRAIVIALIIAPVGIVFMLVTSSSAAFRGPLLTIVFLSSVITMLCRDRINQDILSLVSSIASCGIMFGGFLGTSASDLMRTSGGSVSIALATSHYSSIFGIDAPIMWLSGIGFSHGIHIIPLLVGAMSYYISVSHVLYE